MNNTYYVGDVHGNLAIIDRILGFSNEGDTIIQVGDFGIGFFHDKFFEKYSHKLESKGVNLLAIRGNHDDPSRFDGSKIGSNIELVSDYSIKNINGKNHLFIGGAVSVDRIKRIPNHNWWENEIVQFNEENESFLNSLTDIDVVVTHTCPRTAFPLDHIGVGFYFDEDSELSKDIEIEFNKMDKIKDILTKNNNIKNWMFGHYHVSKSFKYVHREGPGAGNYISYRCLDINEIYYSYP